MPQVAVNLSYKLRCRPFFKTIAAVSSGLAILLTIAHYVDARGLSVGQHRQSAVKASTTTNVDRVAFTSFRPGNWNIYLFKQPGQTAQRLTMGPGLDYDPVVSPDGRWLVFCSERRGSPDLYVLDLKRGGEPHLLIDADSMEDQATFSPDGKSIAFVSTYSGNAEIYLLPFRPNKTLSMTEAENLTHNPAGDFRPAFSPDGHKLAFSSDRDLPVDAISPIIRERSGDIYVLDLASKGLQRLTDAPGWDGSPAWSPDGRTIAFYSQRGMNSTYRNTQARIWAMNGDGSNQHVITPNETVALSPKFMPDGRIVYSRKTKDGLWQIVSIDTDGSHDRVESDSSKNGYWEPARGPSNGTIVAHGTGPNLTAPSERDYPRAPAVGIVDGPFLAAGAPFRKQLPDREIDLYPIRYFTALLNPRKDLLLLTAPGVGSGIFISRTDGSQQHKLFGYDRGQIGFASSSWSRDGEWIAFSRGDVRKPAAESDIWKMRSDGSELQNLTPNSPGNDSYPSFSGDGKQIVFRSGRGGGSDLYLMNADGTNVRRLTNSSDDKVFPVFSPTSRQIAFLSNRDTPESTLYEVYLLDLNNDGSPAQLRRVTRNNVQEGHPAFSYDGKWLIFSSEQGGISDEEPLVQAIQFDAQIYGEMYAYRIQDGMTVRLTHNKWEEGIPSWEEALDSDKLN
jgi:Tol biopolymer transport system component